MSNPSKSACTVPVAMHMSSDGLSTEAVSNSNKIDLMRGKRSLPASEGMLARACARVSLAGLSKSMQARPRPPGERPQNSDGKVFWTDEAYAQKKWHLAFQIQGRDGSRQKALSNAHRLETLETSFLSNNHFEGLS